MKQETKERIKRNPIVVKLLQIMHPSVSTCYTCGLPWTNCKYHIINVTKEYGFFVQCEHCYQKSDKNAILEACQRLWDDWTSDGSVTHLEYTYDEFIEAIHRDLKENGKE